MIQSIQVLRGISIALVLLYHLSALTTSTRELYYFEIGKMGVDIFFIISGYIMAMICERNEPVSIFIKKRIIRIMPLYLMVTVLAALVNYRLPLLQGNESIWESLIQSIFLIPHYSIANGAKIFPIFIPGWTITYEMWFYLSIAFTGLVFSAERKVQIVPVLLLLVYLFSLLLPPAAIGQFLGNSVFLAFIIGILIRSHEKKMMPLVVVLPAVVFVYALAFWAEGLQARLVVLGIPALIIFVSVYLWPRLQIGTLAYVGKISFSLYLTHVFAINFVERVLRGVYPDFAFGLEIMLVIAFVVAIVVADITYRLFEVNLDRFLRKKFA